MPKATGRNSKKNAPTMSINQSVVARYLPGHEWCWCQGFKIGCGRVRSSRACKYHTAREKKIRDGNYDKLVCQICKQSLTLQFVEIQAHPQGDSLRNSVDNFNEEVYQNIQ
jgi:hypothetical protein